MPRSLLRTDKEIAAVYERRRHMLYRICFAYMKTPADAEDAVQETFFRFIQAAPRFESAEHEKAWLIRAASNLCKNELKRRGRKAENIEDHFELAGDGGVPTNDVLQAVLDLPDKYKTVIYLYYYEGYSGPEIAEILRKPQSTVRNHLREARGLLRERLGDDFLEE